MEARVAVLLRMGASGSLYAKELPKGWSLRCGDVAEGPGGLAREAGSHILQP